MRSWRRVAVAVLLPVAFVPVWSSGYLVGSIGTRAADPWALLFWRFTLAAVLAGTVAVVTRAPRPPTARAWVHLLVTGALLQTGQLAGVYLAFTYGLSAGLASLIVSSTPLFVGALGGPLFGEHLRVRQWLGLLVGLAGVAVAVTTEVSGAGGVAGVLGALVGLAGFVSGTLYQKRFGAATDLRTAASVQLLGAAVTGLPLALLHHGLAVPFTPAAIGSTVWLATVNSIGAFLLLFVMLRRRGGSEATSWLFLVPPFTALVAVPLLGEPLHATAFAGIALAAVGVALVTRGARRTRAGARTPADGRGSDRTGDQGGTRTGDRTGDDAAAGEGQESPAR